MNTFYIYSDNEYNTGLFEFPSIYSGDTGDLSVTSTGSGVHFFRDLSLNLQIQDRDGASVGSAKDFLKSAFLKKTNISILGPTGDVVFPNYQSGYKQASYTFAEQDNIDVFGFYAPHFGIKTEVIDKDNQVFSSEFYFYGNTPKISNITVTDTETGYYLTGSGVTPSAITGTNPESGSLKLDIEFLNDTSYVNLDHVDIYWQTGATYFDDQPFDPQYLASSKSLSQNKKQNIFLKEEDLQQLEQVWLTLAPYSLIGLGTKWTIGPFKFDHAAKPELVSNGLTGITSGDITGALGYTPLSSSGDITETLGYTPLSSSEAGTDDQTLNEVLSQGNTSASGITVGASTISGSLEVSNNNTSISDVFHVDGLNGRLFGVTDEVTGTVFSVNDAAGLPIVEVESTSTYDKITMGEYGSDLIVLSGQSSAQLTGSQIASQSWVGQQGFLTSETDDQNLNEVLFQGNTSSYGISVNQITGAALTIDTDTLFVDSTNDRVGIGTDSPDSKLQIVGGDLEVGETDENVDRKITIHSRNAFHKRAEIGYSNGVFGIRPAVGNQTFVFGSASINNMLFAADSSAGILRFRTANSEAMRIASSGEVGIGTTAPSVGLQLGNSVSGQTKTAIFNSEGGSEVGLTIQSRTNRAKLRVADNDSNAYVVAEAGKAFFGTSSNGDTNNITVLTGGNVGIGTTSPNNKLQVNYAPVAIASLTATSGTASTNWNRNAGLMITGASVSNALALGASGTANDRKAWIQVGHPDTAANSLGDLALNPLGGNVGIGTTSFVDTRATGGLHLANAKGIAFQATSSNTNSRAWRIRNDDLADWGSLNFAVGTTNSDFADSSTEVVMTMLRNGRVGIGTTTPSKTLEVNGQLKTASNITCDGTTIFGGSSSLDINLFASGSLTLKTNNTAALTLDSSQNATFAGTISSGSITVGNAGTSRFTDTGASPLQLNRGLAVDSVGAAGVILGLGAYSTGTTYVDAVRVVGVLEANGTDGDLQLQVLNSGSYVSALTLNNDNNATFAGNITTTGSSITIDPPSGDAILNLTHSSQSLRIDQNSIRTTTNTNIAFLTNSTLALTLDTSQNATFAGTVTATHFYGDGSNLTNLPSGADNTKLPLAGGEMTGVIEFAGTGNGYYIGASGGASAPTNELRIGSTTTTNNIGLELYHSTNPVTLGVGYSGGGALAFIESVHGSYDTNTHLRFMPGGTESWRIGSHGSNATYATSFEIKPAAAGNDFYISDNLGTPILYSDTSAGNVGIGITGPSAKLQVRGGIITLGDARYNVRLDDDTAMSQGVGAGLVFGGRYITSSDTPTNFACIWSEKENATSGNFAGQLHLGTRVAGTGGAISSDLVINSLGNVGIGTTSPDAKLKVQSGATSTDSNTLRITHTRSDADVATEAAFIDMNLSGADNTTADRINAGLKIDLDSSANGDATNEHRIYGVDSDVRFTGFSDIARGGYFFAESNYAGGKTAQLAGLYGSATHDANSASGGVSNMYGVFGTTSIQDLGDVDNTFGGYFKVNISTTRTANVGVTKGVEGEIQIDKDTAIDYGEMIGVSSIIDNNEGSTPNFGTQYLFKGDYQGTRGSNAYGVYVEGDKNYFVGNVGVGVENPSRKLHIDQTSSSEGGAYVYSNAIHTGTGTNSLVSIRQDNSAATGTVLDVRGDGTGDKLIVWDLTSVSLIVKDGGNVGIGTDSPAAKLHIGPNPLLGSYTSTRTTLAVSDTANGAELILRGQSPRIWFDATAGGMGEMYLDTVQFNILSGTPTSAGSSRFYIGDSGEVGIGTDSPSANGSKTTLHINSDTNGAAIRLSQASNSSLIRYDNTNGLQIGTIASKNLSFQTADTTAITIDTSQNATFAGNIILPDANPSNSVGTLKFGAGGDLSLYHDGTNSAISNATGALYIQNTADNSDIIFRSDNGSGGLQEYLRLDGSSVGITVSAPQGMVFFDDIKAKFGNNDDLQIYHDGSDSIIHDNGTGNLKIRATNFRVLNAAGTQNMISHNDGSDVKLYYAGNLKLATTSTGVDITGHLSATTKSFLVDNPKTGGKLQYGVVESDEHGVYVRGKSDQEVVELPEEWDWLVHEDSVTVQLTSVGQMQQLFVVEQNNKRIKVSGLAPNGQYNYVVHGTRKDVDALEKHLK